MKFEDALKAMREGKRVTFPGHIKNEHRYDKFLHMLDGNLMVFLREKSCGECLRDYPNDPIDCESLKNHSDPSHLSGEELLREDWVTVE